MIWIFFAIELLYCMMQVISFNFLKAPWLGGSELHFYIWFLGTVSTQPCPLTVIVLQSEHEDFHNYVHLCPNSQCVNTQIDGCSDPSALNGFCVCLTACQQWRCYFSIFLSAGARNTKCKGNSAAVKTAEKRCFFS